MFELDDEGILGYISIRIDDFFLDFKSVSVSEMAPIKRIAGPSYNIQLMISAPPDFPPSKAVGEYTFFLDREAIERKLAQNQYQVIYEGAAHDRSSFYLWACSCVAFFQLMQFGAGMVCVDYADFCTALSCCRGSVLRFEKLMYDQHDQVPYHKHSGPPYRVIYGCLDGGMDLSLGHYLELSSTLEESNPALEIIKLASKYTQSSAYSVMLLGEAVHSS